MSQNTKTVSIIVPAYNVAPYIARCVDSILSQTYPHLELIVVDDCSTDKTPECLADYEGKDARMRILKTPINQGLHAARVLGLLQASGDYIAFVDGDDWVAPEMYEKMLASMLENASDIVLCGAIKATSEDQIIGPKVFFEAATVCEDNILANYAGRAFGTGVIWNKLFKRDLILEYGSVLWEREIDSNADHVVCFGCFYKAKRVSILPDNLYYYYYREDSMSQAGSNALNYSILLRAYARGCQVYGDLGESALRLLDDLYRKQLRGSYYAVQDYEELTQYEESLTVAVRTMAEFRPSALYEWMNMGIADATYAMRKKTLLAQWCELSKRVFLVYSKKLYCVIFRKKKSAHT